MVNWLIDIAANVFIFSFWEMEEACLSAAHYLKRTNVQ